MTIRTIYLWCFTLAICAGPPDLTCASARLTGADYVVQNTVNRLFDSSVPWIQPVNPEAGSSAPCGDVCGCGESVEDCRSVHGGLPTTPKPQQFTARTDAPAVL